MAYTLVDYYKVSEDEIVEMLRSNIKDPLGINRQTGQFVDHGIGHYEGKTPRILVKRGRPIPTKYTGIGELTQDSKLSFLIVVEVAPSAGGEVRGVKKTGPELLNIIVGEVANVMQDNVHPSDNDSDTIIKQIKRTSDGGYDFNPTTNVHFTIQIYEVDILNG